MQPSCLRSSMLHAVAMLGLTKQRPPRGLAAHWGIGLQVAMRLTGLHAQIIHKPDQALMAALLGSAIGVMGETRRPTQILNGIKARPPRQLRYYRALQEG